MTASNLLRAFLRALGVLRAWSAELLQAASRVVHAVVSPRLRRPALTSVGIACALATATVWPSLRRAPDVPAHRDPAAGPARPPDGADTPSTRAEVASRDQPPTDDQIEEMKRSARQRAAWLTRRTEHLEQATMRLPLPSWSPVAAWVLMLTGIWLLVGQWALRYPFTVTGQNTALRDTGLAVLVTLAALRLVVARRSNAATVVALVSGALLVASGLFASHGAARALGNELVCGVLVLAAGLATLDRRRLGRPDGPDDNVDHGRTLATGRRSFPSVGPTPPACQREELHHEQPS